MIKIVQKDNKAWTVQVSKTIGFIVPIIALVVFIWGIAMSWVLTTRVKPIEEKIIAIEQIASESKTRAIELRKDFVEHCNIQAQQFGYIEGQLKILVERK